MIEEGIRLFDWIAMLLIDLRQKQYEKIFLVSYMVFVLRFVCYLVVCYSPLLLYFMHMCTN